ncbi:hypothetical protein ABH935_003125 [Catenulispora sp. GAS73]|uniref:hypothetical protein n=1 Tax=Catenulispora sp. GAS73 TaxID=3156269 RepID=UPI0035110068
MTTQTQPWLRAELIAAPETTPGAQLMIPADGVEFHDDQLVFHHQGDVVYVAAQGQLRSITWFAKQPNPETARRKAQWPKHGTRWTDEERTDLHRRIRAGESWKTISLAHGRSRTGCQQEAVKQGWIHPDTLRPTPELLLSIVEEDTDAGPPRATAQVPAPDAGSADATVPTAPSSTAADAASARAEVPAPDTRSADGTSPTDPSRTVTAAPAEAPATTAALPTAPHHAAAGTTADPAAPAAQAQSPTAPGIPSRTVTAAPAEAPATTATLPIAPHHAAAETTADPAAAAAQAQSPTAPGIPSRTTAETTADTAAGSAASPPFDPGPPNMSAFVVPVAGSKAVPVAAPAGVSALTADIAMPNPDRPRIPPRVPRQRTDPNPQPEPKPDGDSEKDSDPGSSPGSRFLSRAQSSLARATLGAYMNPPRGQSGTAT